jgi:hypothetical protein
MSSPIEQAKLARQVARQAYFDARDKYMRSGPGEDDRSQAEALGPFLKAWDDAKDALDKAINEG